MMRTILLIVLSLCLSGHAALEALPRGLDELNKAGFKGDLGAIKKRGFIRVLTRNAPGCYFIHRGELVGFEYELVRHFAKQHNLEVIVIVPPSWDEMGDWLKSGRADLAAANITITAHRKNIQGVQFCHPYGEVFEMVISRKDDDSIKSIADLNGRTFHVRKSSAYFESLTQLKEKTGAMYNIRVVPEDEETFGILEKVSNGTYDLTLADHTLLDQSISLGSNVKGALRLKRERSYGWVVRTDQPELQSAINRFFEEEYKGTTFNILYKRYFHTGLTGKHSESFSKMKSGEISPYDELVKQASAKYDLPWTLISSQMYQESRFDPDAKSWSGALGLMQLMPATAKELGVQNPLDPADNIDGGVKYMRRQYNRVSGEVSAVDRTCFALAAYNGGYGHLIDARKLAERLGNNPNIWVGNVESAYALLSNERYAKQARYGYCRSDEIINYVSRIMTRYIAFDRALQNPSQD